MQQTAAAWAIASLFGNAGPRPQPKRSQKRIQRCLPISAQPEGATKNGLQRATRDVWAPVLAIPEDPATVPATLRNEVRSEAKSLLELVGKNGETIVTVRNLIGIEPHIEKMLLEFVDRNPQETLLVMRAMGFRALVLGEFNRLAKNAEHAELTAAATPRAAHQVPARPILNVLAVTERGESRSW